MASECETCLCFGGRQVNLGRTMHAPSSPSNTSLSLLVQAITLSPAEDGLTNTLTPAQWDLLTGYLQPCELAPGEILIKRGTAVDRTVYFVQSGSLSVHYEDDKGRLRLALVGAGGLLGEGAFFSHAPRSATVQAGSPCTLWSLSSLRFAELSNRQPAIALGLTLAMGGVLAKRLANRRRRIATT